MLKPLTTPHLRTLTEPGRSLDIPTSRSRIWEVLLNPHKLSMLKPSSSSRESMTTEMGKAFFLPLLPVVYQLVTIGFALCRHQPITSLFSCLSHSAELKMIARSSQLAPMAEAVAATMEAMLEPTEATMEAMPEPTEEPTAVTMAELMVAAMAEAMAREEVERATRRPRWSHDGKNMFVMSL